MKTTTDYFDSDSSTFVLIGKSKSDLNNKCRVKFEGVKLTSVITPWYYSTSKNTEENIVQFRTVFNLYKSKEKYFLEIIGESSNKSKYIDKTKILVFSSPSEFSKKLYDPDYKEVYLSDYIIKLLDEIVSSHYLSKSEKEEWESILTEAYI